MNITATYTWNRFASDVILMLFEIGIEEVSQPVFSNRDRQFSIHKAYFNLYF